MSGIPGMRWELDEGDRRRLLEDSPSKQNLRSSSRLMASALSRWFSCWILKEMGRRGGAPMIRTGYFEGFPVDLTSSRTNSSCRVQKSGQLKDIGGV